MKYCKQCGNELSSEDKFCKECGTPASITEQSKRQSPDTIQQPKLSDSPSRTGQMAKKKKKVPKWVISVAAIMILAIVGAIGVIAMNGGNEKKAIEATAEPEKDTKPPSISEEEVSALFPGWQKIREEVVHINDSYYTLLAIANDEVEFEEKVKIAVVDYDSHAEGDKWSLVWETEEYYGDPILDIDSYIGDFYVVAPEESSIAMVVFNVMHAGSGPIYDTFAITIDDDGKGETAWTGTGSTIEDKGDYIEVLYHGATRLAVANDEVQITEIPRSEVGSADALKVEFTLDSDGLVVPTEDEDIYVKVGHPITFVPSDDKTKKLFDEGDISIYYDSMEHAPINTSNANLVYAGNEFTFTDEGEYGFLLDFYVEGADFSTPPYTFVVHVGDGVKPPETEKAKEEQPVEPEKEEHSQSSSTEIIAPFPIGTPVSELKAHYGEPTYDDYYSGGWLTMFDGEGYFIDEMDQTVRGFYFSEPTLSIFGAKVGMTAKEINTLYSESTEPEISDLSDEYILVYYKNGFKIFFDLESKDGPTTAVMISPE